MGIGPVPAIRNLLSKTGHQLSDIDLIEVSASYRVNQSTHAILC